MRSLLFLAFASQLATLAVGQKCKPTANCQSWVDKTIGKGRNTTCLHAPFGSNANELEGWTCVPGWRGRRLCRQKPFWVPCRCCYEPANSGPEESLVSVEPGTSCLPVKAICMTSQPDACCSKCCPGESLLGRCQPSTACKHKEPKEPKEPEDPEGKCLPLKAPCSDHGPECCSKCCFPWSPNAFCAPTKVCSMP